MTTPKAESQEPFALPGMSVVIIGAVLILTVSITVVLDGMPLRTGATAPAQSVSVCHPDKRVIKLGDVRQKAPPVDEWAFDTTPVAYPKSKEYGPWFIEHKGAAAAPAYGMCFQRSPEGALFAATHAAAESLQKQPNTEWAEEFVASYAESRSEAIDTLTKEDLLVSLGYKPEEVKRVEIAGYKYGNYGYGLDASIHIGIRVTDNKDEVTYLTSTYKLVWEENDWKFFPLNPADPTRTRLVPNLDGYISWR